MRARIAIGPSSFAEEDDAPLRRLKETGCEIVPNPFARRLTEAEIIAHLRGVDGLIAGLEPLNARVITSAAPKLRAIARVGIGVDNVDFDAAAKHHVKVSSTPEGPTQAVAELTLAAMLALCRRLVPTDAALHRGEWKKIVGQGLDGATLLIIGYGRIGRRVTHLALPFGARVLVFDPFISAEALLGGVIHEHDLHTALSEADIVSLHAGAKDTLLGPAEFAAMRDGALLLNSARGELINEDALISALDSGKVAGAWLDAFWKEPYTGRLTNYGQMLLTPHVGTYTRQCRLSMESKAVENLLRDLELA
jgi:D-3-phosphoglycerate dehydrogenase